MFYLGRESSEEVIFKSYKVVRVGSREKSSTKGPVRAELGVFEEFKERLCLELQMKEKNGSR